ncbi:hypothetical protein BJY16_005734 [Actinoplanes octamycinicus]|uniref:Uncharacterized protein n=1 Tax=Actinoplanes octamycinicus TaxID=135948 RepID=A0A7W7M9Y0_9ACTN|nr:hypothetical protein [Actinoplanes octamycinicus]MBB4742275.1 hypothetical protein [Actinoplanes octamycinicus]GIE59880.1 hypothetical protein Aoc01nite_52820 [Actinoplanes octamycinicus]
MSINLGMLTHSLTVPAGLLSVPLLVWRSSSDPILPGTPSLGRLETTTLREEGRDLVDGEPKDCRPTGKRLSWRTAGEAAFLLLRIAAGVAALYGALKGGGLV